jgi:hypothetical protein
MVSTSKAVIAPLLRTVGLFALAGGMSKFLRSGFGQVKSMS